MRLSVSLSIAIDEQRSAFLHSIPGGTSARAPHTKEAVHEDGFDSC